MKHNPSRTGRLSWENRAVRLAVLLLSLLVSLLILERSVREEAKPWQDIQLKAAQKTAEAFAAIREERLRRGDSFSPADDPNQTGLIGSPYTEITTTLGNLESKRSTTNPNTAAMITDMLLSLGVKPGDTVAVSFSSSFPCLNTAVLCSRDVIGAEGIVVSSVGASSYGANDPAFTWLDMDHFLFSRGIIKNHSAYFSMGGSGDQGKEMPEETKLTIRSRLENFGLTFLDYEELGENIAARESIYFSENSGEGSSGPPAVFINAGGNLLSFGGGTELISADNGILLPCSVPEEAGGLIPLFLRRAIPVIPLLNMKSLLPSYGLPVDPVPLPEVGSGGVYNEKTCSKALAAVLLVFNLGAAALTLRGFPRRRLPL